MQQLVNRTSRVTQFYGILERALPYFIGHTGAGLCVFGVGYHIVTRQEHDEHSRQCQSEKMRNIDQDNRLYRQEQREVARSIREENQEERDMAREVREVGREKREVARERREVAREGREVTRYRREHAPHPSIFGRPSSGKTLCANDTFAQE